MKHTSFQHVKHSIIHSPPQTIGQLSEVGRSVLFHERSISVSDSLLWSNDSEEVAEGNVPVDASDGFTGHRTDTVVASKLVVVVEEGLDVSPDVHVGIIGCGTVGVVGMPAEALRFGTVGDLVVVPNVICGEGVLS